MTPIQNSPAGEGEDGSLGSSGFAEPPHVPRTASADSYQRTGAANNNTHQPEFESHFRPLPIWKTSPSSAEVQISKQKLRHIPIDISPYIALSRNHSTTNHRLAERRPSLPEVYARHDKDEGSIRLRVKRHVPIVIPAFAHPFVNDLTKKPPFQPTVRAWSPAPKLRRELRQLPSSDNAVAELPVNSIDDVKTMRMSLMNGTADKMNISQTNQPTPEMTRHPQDAFLESATPQSGQPGIASSMSQQVDGAGPTNLSGLVCNVHRTTGREPHALVGATTTILGDKLYVFGGRILSRRKPRLTSDLYELDLMRRHWSKLETFGEVPPPRYFHSVCALGDTKLVCYGGMSPATQSAASTLHASDPQPEVVVMSDIHIYDVPTRTWMFIPTPDTPQGRYAHCATILPSSATFTSPTAPFSAIQHNPPSSNPHSGSIGVKLDGAGGAEMVVVGGQDSSNHYIEQISVFNLRSLKWTATNSLGRQCGAYRSVVTPLTGMPVSAVGRVSKPGEEIRDTVPETSSSMLIYSNYNFLDVKLELQIRFPDGTLNERFMGGAISPPGLRFPNGGVIDHHFVVSGTYLTSAKQEYALWALDLRNLTWSRIDAGGAVFGQGSWNRGVLWNRRNTFVILGHRKRSLVEDYNQRRINFSHVCMVELEAFGLYDNPRKAAPSSGYVSVSSPSIPRAMWPKVSSKTGIRPVSSAAETLGQLALSLKETADMELLAIGGERIPVNSHVLSRRWGPFFNRLLRQSSAGQDRLTDALCLRPQMNSQASRNSSVTITPSLGHVSTYSAATTLHANSLMSPDVLVAGKSPGVVHNLESPDTVHLPPSVRPRSLYLPHKAQTLRLMLHYLYTSSLPTITSPLCTPQILCSVLQLARPYQIDGLLEATVERLHEVLDGRNAAAVFNASAMAAGGGKALEEMACFNNGRRPSEAGTINGNMGGAGDSGLGRTLSAKTAGLRIDTSFGETRTGIQRGRVPGHQRSQSEESAASASTAASVATSVSDVDTHSETQRDSRPEKEIWTGDLSSVIGLQKRGLRGLMEGRRLRERGYTNSNPSFNAASAGASGQTGGQSAAAA
jgi:Galactose oxidase, central domain